MSASSDAAALASSKASNASALANICSFLLMGFAAPLLTAVVDSAAVVAVSAASACFFSFFCFLANSCCSFLLKGASSSSASRASSASKASNAAFDAGPFFFFAHNAVAVNCDCVPAVFLCWAGGSQRLGLKASTLGLVTEDTTSRTDRVAGVK